MGLINRTISNNKEVLPVWFMRQAGRYHSHYQKIKATSNFMEMCKTPKLACEITMGPIEDFNFDAAILFSDLLFPLEQLDLGLSYKSGPPTLEKNITTIDIINSLKPIAPANIFYDFQKKALELLKKKLPKDKTLIGFVGAPFTLYTYAMEGSHSGNLIESKKGLYDGRFELFMKKLMPELIENCHVQLSGGADMMALFDTAAGELCLKDYNEFIVPQIRKLSKAIKEKYPQSKIIYYSKTTQFSYLDALDDQNIDILGIDWRNNLVEALKRYSTQYYIQGNIDPCWLHLPIEILQKNIEGEIKKVKESGVDMNKWIAGLGHGVLQHTPENNVRKAVAQFQQTTY